MTDAGTDGGRPIEERGGIEGFIRRRFLLGVAFGVLITAVFIAVNDGSKVLNSLHIFDWRLAPLILALSLCNYLLRFAKWHFYLGSVRAGPISKTTSFVIFFAGLSMAITPGKIGEMLKPYLVRRVNGTLLATTTPVIVAERITDGIAILVLAAVGLLQIRYGWTLLVVLALAFVIFMVLVQRRTLVEAIL
ncbi:MAG TPA: lysylphosphatidylglycerol synthase transmembrane domain-containing protein, partial [Nitrolancea sp.]|nr:lysylphosphatidylglycerol synthase transmembrane domain-containing protein [Nitrolancea sp.]